MNPDAAHAESTEVESPPMPAPTTSSVNEWIRPIVQSHEHLFATLTGAPPNERVRHAIRLTPGARPVMKRPYRLAAAQRLEAEKQIKHALNEG